MKKTLLIRFTCVLILGVLNSSGAMSQQETIATTYSGNSPCGSFAKSLLNIPLSADCDRIKWTVTFLQNPKTHAPLSFKLSSIYGMQEQSRPGFVGGGAKIETEGKWIISKGTKVNPDATVYQLNTGNQFIYFVKIDDAILHLLYADKNLMIGDAGWSYTLNKIKN